MNFFLSDTSILNRSGKMANEDGFIHEHVTYWATVMAYAGVPCVLTREDIRELVFRSLLVCGIPTESEHTNYESLKIKLGNGDRMVHLSPLDVPDLLGLIAIPYRVKPVPRDEFVHRVNNPNKEHALLENQAGLVTQQSIHETYLFARGVNPPTIDDERLAWCDKVANEITAGVSELYFQQFQSKANDTLKEIRNDAAAVGTIHFDVSKLPMDVLEQCLKVLTGVTEIDAKKLHPLDEKTFHREIRLIELAWLMANDLYDDCSLTQFGFVGQWFDERVALDVRRYLDWSENRINSLVISPGHDSDKVESIEHLLKGQQLDMREEDKKGEMFFF